MFERRVDRGDVTLKLQQCHEQYNKWDLRVRNESEIQTADGINTEMNKTSADHINKSPTVVPRDDGRTGVCPVTIPMIVDDKGEKERGSGSHSRVTVDCIW